MSARTYLFIAMFNAGLAMGQGLVGNAGAYLNAALAAIFFALYWKAKSADLDRGAR